jgi:hypothetical protein
LWIRWWGSSGFLLEGQICEVTDPPKNCESYNVFFYSTWRLAKAADHWSALVTAIATAFVAWFTWTLWQSNEKMWQATKTAADAALRQANAMVAAESPIFTIASLKLVGYEDERSGVATVDPVLPGVPPHFCRPLIFFQNSGRTGVTINRVFCDWTVAPTVEETPVYHFEEIWNGYLGKESSIWFRSQNGIGLSDLEAEHIENFGAFLWVYGKIIYTDFLGDRFEHGYIARWDTVHGFVREPLAAYEYKRKA